MVSEYQAKKLETDLRKLQNTSKLGQSQKAAVFKFLDLINAQGRAPATKRNIIWALITIGEFLGKPFEEADYEDIVRVVGLVETKYQSGKTKKMLKAEVRRFYKWLRKTSDFPPEVNWIKLDYRVDSENRIAPEDMLTDAEIDALANVTLNSRDKALVHMLSESGCRIGELLSLRIKNIKFDNKGVLFHISEGKTGRRQVRLDGKHTKELLRWLDEHPLKDDPEAPVWVSLSSNSKNKCLTYVGVEILLKRLAVKCGLGKWVGGNGGMGSKPRGSYVGRPVNPHNFRHKKATDLLIHRGIPEALVKRYMGWSNRSRIAEVYTHFNDQDVDNAILKSNGIDAKNVEKTIPLDSRVCANCGEVNTVLSHFCKKCNSLLDLSIAWKEKDDAVAKVLEELAKDEWFRTRIKEIVSKLNLEKEFQESI